MAEIMVPLCVFCSCFARLIILIVKCTSKCALEIVPFYLQDDIVEGMAKEYLRPAGVPSCRDSGAIHKEASYKDGKILKTYRTSNRCSSLFSFEICFEVVGNPLKHMMHKL